MWYLIVNGVLALWVVADTQKRHAPTVQWALWTLAIGLVTVPVYLAKRPLSEGQVREGGTAWNVIKNFIVVWTLMMIVAGIVGVTNVATRMSPTASDLETGASAVGATIGLGLMGFLWFAVAAGALVLGLILKKSSIIEHGPSGVQASSKGWALGGAVAVLVVFLGSFSKPHPSGTETAAGYSAKSFAAASAPETQGLRLEGDWRWERGDYGTLYIAGSISNPSSKAYSYAQVMFTLYDATGAQVGTAMANAASLEPHGRWNFRAIVLEPERVKNARLTGIQAF